jgi:hypothetical protein
MQKLISDQLITNLCPEGIASYRKRRDENGIYKYFNQTKQI